MTQSAPTVLLYAQAMIMLGQLQDDYALGTVKTSDDIDARIRDILTQFEQSAGTPFFQFEPVAEGEPPISDKINRLWTLLQGDINILQNQVDVLRAASVFMHNYISTEIMQSSLENQRINNKLSTLQLYSNSVDASIVTFGDSFRSQDYIDFTMVNAEEVPNLSDGMLTLGRQGDLKDLSLTAGVSVVSSSNGIRGNNQEIEDPATASTDPSSGEPLYVFVAESDSHADLTALTDGAPDKWFEYESYWVSAADRLKAGGFNFSYQASDGTLVDWAAGPSSGVLDLVLQFDLGSMQNINYVSYVPYGLKNNSNTPVLIAQVALSTNGTDWTVVSPQNVWIGTDPNLQTARIASNVVTGNSVWAFDKTATRYIQILVQQPNPIPCNVGHVYYVTKDGKTRLAGPTPPLSDPAKFYEYGGVLGTNAVRKREYFQGQRWAIGIRDISIQQVQYYERSVMVTTPLRVGGIVDRVSLDADISIPSDFDSSMSWVNFYITPDDGKTWFPISRIHDDYLGVPEIIAFNDPLPAAFQEPGVSYQKVDNTVDSIRLKIEILRPSDSNSSTPIVRSYSLKVKRR